MDTKRQEKLERDEAEFSCYVKGKYFADKEFLKAIADGKFFEEETTRVNVNKANSEMGTKAYADAVGDSNAKDVILTEKIVRGETAKETTNAQSSKQKILF